MVIACNADQRGDGFPDKLPFGVVALKGLVVVLLAGPTRVLRYSPEL